LERKLGSEGSEMLREGGGRGQGGEDTGRGQRRELVAFSRGFLLRLSFGGRCRGILSEAAYVYLSAQI
jgi:hypothetical protein